MIELLKQQAAVRGEKLQVLPIRRLQDIKIELGAFQKDQDLNGFQKWILSDLYQLDLPSTEFTIRSLILIAIPHPAYANVEFIRRGKRYGFVSLVRSDFEGTERNLSDLLVPANYHIKPAGNVPLKRLAVRSGLAVYGRNNICFVEGMGSFFSFAAYFSDMACDDSHWVEIRQSERCTHCRACLKLCPTGAIRKDRFLIDNERCLSNLNESPGEFPEWLSKSVHHCLYDCLKCQIQCPINKEYVGKTIGPIEFSEDETDMLLSGSRLEAFSPALQDKSRLLGLDEWLASIPRNLRALFELSDQAG